MAKKFGKFLLATAAIGSAAAAACYFLKKKDEEDVLFEDEDFDSTCDSPEEDGSDSPNDVPVDPETNSDADSKETGDSGETGESAHDSFTPLKETAEKVVETAEQTAENVEEFFDEEDGSDEEPPISKD